MLTWGHARRQAAAFPEGARVPVYYNPRNPAVSCLRRGGLAWEDIFMLFVSGSALVMGTRQARRFLSKWMSESTCDTGTPRGG
jgi:hypothetical protein